MTKIVAKSGYHVAIVFFSVHMALEDVLKVATGQVNDPRLSGITSAHQFVEVELKILRLLYLELEHGFRTLSSRLAEIHHLNRHHELHGLLLPLNKKGCSLHPGLSCNHKRAKFHRHRSFKC